MSAPACASTGAHVSPEDTPTAATMAPSPAPTPARNDPMDALPSSVLVRGAVAADGRCAPHVPQVEAFLARWGAWYQRQVVAAGRLDQLYARTLSLAIAGVLEAPAVVAALSSAARRVGLTVELSLAATDALQAQGDAPHAELDTLLALVDAVVMHVPQGLAAERPGALGGLLRRLAAARPVLSLAVAPADLQALGLLSDPLFCGRTFTVFAAALSTGRFVRVDGPVAMPCRGHLRLVVGPDGAIHPCASLADLPAARLGHVADTDLDAMFDGLTRGALQRLARDGPLLPPTEAPRPLPYDVCALHRASLEGASRLS